MYLDPRFQRCLVLFFRLAFHVTVKHASPSLLASSTQHTVSAETEASSSFNWMLFVVSPLWCKEKWEDEFQEKSVCLASH